MPSEAFKRDPNNVPVGAGIGNDADQDTLQFRVDPTTKRLLTLSLSEEDGHDAVGDGTTTLTTAGTAVQLASNTCKRVFIQAQESNTGTLVVGGSTVVAALVGRRGLALYPTQSAVFYVSNTNLLYIDSTVSGDKCNWFYEN